MSAETLREAAALMREHAGLVGTLDGGVPQPGWHSVPSALWVHCRTWRGIADVVNYAASWHPAVALAVADWLDGMAAGIDSTWTGLSEGSLPEPYLHALAVARAYRDPS